jgi:ATP-dependent Clp protease ATP-binding subunit ClpB
VQLGFAPQAVDKKDSYTSSVKKMLPPELVSRMDEIVIFDSLSDDSISKIFTSRLNEIHDYMKCKVEIHFSISANDFIDFKSEDHARDIKKLIRKSIEIPLAKFIVKNPEVKKVSVKMLDGNVNIC